MAFEAFLTQDKEQLQPKRKRWATHTVSISLHGILLVAASAYSFWHVEELTVPSIRVTLFSMAAAVPPPPPPAAETPKPKSVPQRQKPKITAPVLQKRPEEIVQPPERPEPPPPVQQEGEGSGEGTNETASAAPVAPTVGGTAGGEGAAPPPPVMIPPSVAVGQRLTDLNDPQFRPKLPPPLRRPGMVVWGLFKICVTAEGRVKDVKLVKSADPLVDDEWSSVLGRWQYRPYTVDGRGVPFCHVARVEIRSES